MFFDPLMYRSREHIVPLESKMHDLQRHKGSHHQHDEVDGNRSRPVQHRVNCACPGITHTPALDTLLAELGMSVEEAGKHYLGRAMIKCFGKLEEIAPAIPFLASDEASYMTAAAAVVLDGGYSS